MNTVAVELSSLSPLMFNTFRGQEEIPPEKKLTLASDGKTLVLPASNIMGFLTSTLVGRSCINTFVPPKERQERKADVLASVAVKEMTIPILGEGKPIEFSGFNGRVYVDERAAQASKTARVIARRPVIAEPWGLRFSLLVNPSEYVTIGRLEDWFKDGGLAVGLGAYRPFFGKFEVVKWEVEA